jgi:hypothetical protein
MGVGETVGGLAGLAASAPIAVVDPNSRRSYDDQVKHLGPLIDDAVGAATDQ